MLRGADKSQSDGVGASFPNDTLAVPSPFLDGTEGSEERSAQPSAKQERVATERERAAAAAKQAHADFVKYQELSQKELDDFLQWAETIMNADAPMDTSHSTHNLKVGETCASQTTTIPKRLTYVVSTGAAKPAQF